MISRRLIYCLIALLALPFLGSAQEKIKKQRSLRFSFSPSAIVNIYPGIQVGLDKRISALSFLELEGAYLPPVRDNQNDIRDGYRIKLGFKKYASEKKDHMLSVILFHRKTLSDRSEEFSRFDDAYFQRYDFTKTKTLYGLTLGYLRALELFNTPFQIGLSVGPGLYIISDGDTIPEDAVQWTGVPLFSIYERERRAFYPVTSVQAKFLF